MPNQNSERNRAGAEGAMVLAGAPEEMLPLASREAFTAIVSNCRSMASVCLFQLHIAPQGQTHVVGLALAARMATDAQDLVLTAPLSEVKEQLPRGPVLELGPLDDPDSPATVRHTSSALATRKA